MMRTLGCLLLVAALLLVPRSDTISADVAPPPREVKPQPPAPPAQPNTAGKMPLTGLAPAKPMFDACIYKYSVSTTNAQCQAFVNQGLGMYYSYVWLEAARAFETAVQLDPDCAYAWLMLHRSMEKWGRPGSNVPPGAVTIVMNTAAGKTVNRAGKPARDHALDMARTLMPKANHREQLLIQSRLQEKGMWPNVGPDERRKKAQQSLDELLTLYDDDEEGWFWRAQLASGDGPHAASMFYKALLRVNPLHPGANHELVHFFENIRRPALGWPYAENYIKSSPGIPHAYHMQAHLGTRIGKWGVTTDWSYKAVELQMAYHKYQGVTPGEDHQFSHHLDILLRSLIHDGRFTEAKEIRQTAEGTRGTGGKGANRAPSFRADFLRMAIAQRDWDTATALIDQVRRTNKADGAYYAALVSLEKGDTAQAGREVDTLRQLQQARKADKALERRLWEVQGLYLCQKGDGEEGVKLLKKLVDSTKNEFSHHAWGNGAVYMESWGIGALEAGNAIDAEEAFLEALAHDSGSVRAALGLWALCERQGRLEEAARYLKLAQKFWAKADPKDFAALQSQMANRATKVPKTAARPLTTPTRTTTMRTLLCLSLALALTPALGAADPCVSGTPVGKRPGPYSFLVATGPQRGQQTCYICEQHEGNKPGVVVFARTTSPQLGKLLAKLDAAALAEKDAGGKVWLTLLADKADLDTLAKWAKDAGLKACPVGTFEDADGPPSYKLHKEADVTVLIFTKQKVVANFAFRAGELNESTIDTVLKAATPVLAGK